MVLPSGYIRSAWLLEFQLQGIPFVAQPKMELEYKGTKLEQYFKADFVCYGSIVVELKALPKLLDMCRSQIFELFCTRKNSGWDCL